MSTSVTRKIACISVAFILSKLHLLTAQSCLKSLRNSDYGDFFYTLAVVNAIRSEVEDEKVLTNIYDELIFNDVNILARAWNKGITNAVEHGATHILVHNLDLQFHPGAIKHLADALDQNPEYILCSPRLWLTKKTLNYAELIAGVADGGHFCCFMVRPDFFEIVGEFDELFSPAYQEDIDMFRRISLQGYKTAFVNDAYVFHTEGGTIRGLLTIEGLSVSEKIERARDLLVKIKTNDQRYADKWGGAAGQETYKTPYNKDLSLKATKQDGKIDSGI